jgi:hypothetical protein
MDPKEIGWDYGNPIRITQHMVHCRTLVGKVIDFLF